MEEVGSELPIALAHVSSNILHDVMRYCTYHSHHSICLTKDNAKRWEVEYLKEKHEELVLELARISNPHYLYIKNIFDVACETISEMMNEESPRRIFEILNAQEEEEMSDENVT
jgi:hypothetical protein